MVPALLFLLAQAPSGVVSATDPLVRLIGRFDTSSTTGVRCAWSGSTVEFKYKGGDVVAKVNESGSDFLQVELDGKPADVIALKEGNGEYTVQAKEGIHTIRFVKRTEPFVGTVQFKGFDLKGGKLLPIKGPKRHIEVIGDSISCAYGNEGKDKDERFKPETENAYLGYALTTGRLVGADCTIIAWSGRKMYPNNTTPEIYDMILPTEPGSKWSFKAPAPNAILINLSTNEFYPTNPEEKPWTGAYETFIARLRGHYPKARIYCALGPMMSDTFPVGNNALSTLRGYLTKMVERIHAAGDKNVAVIEFPLQSLEKDGIGSDWHPSVKKHQSMAQQFAAQLRKDVGW